MCPVLSPPGSSDSGGYVQPVNDVDSTLTVSGHNFPVSRPILLLKQFLQFCSLLSSTNADLDREKQWHHD